MRSREAANVEGADDDAEVLASRMLQGDDVEAPLLDVPGERVDLGVGVDDGLGEAQVGVEQRLCGPVHRRPDQSRDLHESSA